MLRMTTSTAAHSASACNVEKQITSIADRGPGGPVCASEPTSRQSTAQQGLDGGARGVVSLDRLAERPEPPGAVLRRDVAQREAFGATGL